MSLEDDREALESALGIVELLRVDPDARVLVGDLRETMGVALYDQHMQATKEAKNLALTPTSKFYSPGTTHDPETQAKILGMTLAGVIRCMNGHKCVHAGAGDRPLLALLGHRLITCSGCAATFEHVVAAQEARVNAGLDLICDFCLEESRTFTPSRLPYGPVIVSGDMCDVCHALSQAK